MKIALNLASRPFVDVGPAMKRLRIAMMVLAGFSLLALVGLHLVHSKAEAARAREHSLDGAIANINRERQGYEALMAQSRNATFMTEVDELNTLFSKKAFSWTMAIESLETELPGGVQVTELEPQRSKDGRITLHLRVVGPHDLSDSLVRNLEHSRRFELPRIVGEDAESSNNANQRTLDPVSMSNRFNFDLQAEYVAPSADELAQEKKKQKPVEEARQARQSSAPKMLRPDAAFRPAPARGPYPGAGGPVNRKPYPGGPQ